MTDIMRHDQIEQLLPAAALEILEGDELLQVRSHVRDCTGCARLLDSYREAVAGIATSLPERPLQPARSVRVRARLVARAARQMAASTPVAPRAARSWMIDRWAGWAVAAGLAGILLIHHAVHRPLDYGWLVAGGLVLLALALTVYIRVQRARVSALEERLSSLSLPEAEEANSGPADRTASPS